MEITEQSLHPPLLSESEILLEGSTPLVLCKKTDLRIIKCLSFPAHSIPSFPAYMFGFPGLRMKLRLHSLGKESVSGGP